MGLKEEVGCTVMVLPALRNVCGTGGELGIDVVDSVCKSVFHLLLSEVDRGAIEKDISSLVSSRLGDCLDGTRLSFLVRRMASKVSLKAYFIMSEKVELDGIEFLYQEVNELDFKLRKVFSSFLVRVVLNNPDGETRRPSSLIVDEVVGDVINLFSRTFCEEFFDHDQFAFFMTDIVLDACATVFIVDAYFEVFSLVRAGIFYSATTGPYLDRAVERICHDVTAKFGMVGSRLELKDLIVTAIAQTILVGSDLGLRKA